MISCEIRARKINASFIKYFFAKILFMRILITIFAYQLIILIDS